MQNTRIGIIVLNLISSIKNKLQIAQEQVALDKEASFVVQRKYVEKIIIAVLTDRMSVRRGLTLFPQGSEDESVRTAWHALCHYEADEDLRKNDIEYNNEQVAFLEMIAFEFKDGNPLPQNIIDSYKPYYKDNPITYEAGLKGIIKKLFRFLSM